LKQGSVRGDDHLLATPCPEPVKDQNWLAVVLSAGCHWLNNQHPLPFKRRVLDGGRC
jgi:hypothetical protein